MSLRYNYTSPRFTPKCGELGLILGFCVDLTTRKSDGEYWHLSKQRNLKELEKIDIETLGKKIQNIDIFPESVNVEFATILEDNSIRMKVWERGAGRTLACGSGACATLVAANKQELSLRKNDIILDGGKLTINWLETEDIIMSGEVNLVFKGNFYFD